MSAAAAASTERVCSTCGSALCPVVAGPGEVTIGTVAATVTGPSAWACPRALDTTGAASAHDRIAPTTARARAVTQEALVCARRTVLRGTLRCGVCDTPFVLPGRRTSRSVTVTWEGPPVTLTLDVPVLRCTEDAVDNVPPEALRDALAAIDVLLEDRS